MANSQRFDGPVTLIVGPEKTASTFAQKLLELHPDIRLPQGIKETFFFERFFGNGIDWYLSRFDLSGDAPHLVEVAPGCFSEPAAIERIKSVFPQARIILCAREPVARTISHYNHLRRYGYLNAPLAECLDPDEKPLKASLYSVYCPLWEEAFGAENVAMLDMNLLQADPEAFARTLFVAANIAPIAVPQDVLQEKANAAAEPRHFLVARAATYASNLMKRYGLYRALDVLRKSPIHGLVYGNQKPSGTVDGDVVRHLEELLAPERAYLRRHYGLDYGPQKTAQKP